MGLGDTPGSASFGGWPVQKSATVPKEGAAARWRYPRGAEEEAFGRRSAFGLPKAFDRFPEDRLEGESTELLSEAGLGWVLKSK